MTLNRQKIITIFLKSSKAAGMKYARATEIAQQLLLVTAQYDKMAEPASLRQIIQEAGEILATVYPELVELFPPYDENLTSPSDNTRKVLPSEIAKKVMIREILRGISIFDINPVTKTGAKQLFDICESPLPTPSHPFVDDPDNRIV